MHEMSLALEVCRIAEAHLPAPGRSRVLAVGVELGRDAGVEPGSFRFCLEALLAEPPFEGARAEIVPSPGEELRLLWVEVDDGDPDH